MPRVALAVVLLEWVWMVFFPRSSMQTNSANIVVAHLKDRFMIFSLAHFFYLSSSAFLSIIMAHRLFLYKWKPLKYDYITLRKQSTLQCILIEIAVTDIHNYVKVVYLSSPLDITDDIGIFFIGKMINHFILFQSDWLINWSRITEI